MDTLFIKLGTLGVFYHRGNQRAKHPHRTRSSAQQLVTAEERLAEADNKNCLS
jgi:hypothetical protein